MNKFLTNISGGQFIGAVVGLGILSSMIGKASPILSLIFVPMYIALFYSRAKRLDVTRLFYVYLASAVGIFVIPSAAVAFILMNGVIFLYLTFKNVKI